MHGRFDRGSKRKSPGDDTSQAEPPKRSRINIHEDSRRRISQEATAQAGSSKKTITDTHEKDGKRGRDSDDDSEQAGPSKKSRPDSIQNDSKRMGATKVVLDVLLKPPERERTPREQEVYRQSLEEVQRLNTGDYAINAHNNEELALRAARRAHLKALISPGDFPDERMMNDWKPGKKWAQWAETAEKYKQQVERAESKRQQLEKECPITTLNEAIHSPELKDAISICKGEESQQAKLEHCEQFKARLETIRDYLEGKPIGIAKADSAWRWVKERQANPVYIAMVDLRQLLNLLPQETASLSEDQTKTSQETTSSHYALAQQHFEQFLRHAEGMLKALPDNEFKTTSQERFDTLITTYTTMTPDTATTFQLQEVYTQMKTLHYDLAQQHFEQSRRDAQGILEVLPTDEFKTTNQERFDTLITTYTTMTPDSTTPSQLQEVSTQMKNLHYVLLQQHFEQLRRDAEDMLKALPDNAFKTTSQEGYNALITSYKKMDRVNRIPSQLQEVYTQMTALRNDLMQQNFENTQVQIEGTATLDSPEAFRNKFNDLQHKYQNATTFDQRQDIHQQIIDLHIEALRQDFKKLKKQVKKFMPHEEGVSEAFLSIMVDYRNFKLESNKTGYFHQKMVDVHGRMVYFYREQAATLGETAQRRIQDLLLTPVQDSFKVENQAEFDTLETFSAIRDVPLYQSQDVLDKMLAFHHKLVQRDFHQTKADIKTLINFTPQGSIKNDLDELNALESKWNELESESNASVKFGQATQILEGLWRFHHQLVQRETQFFLTHLTDHTRKTQSQKDFDALQSEYIKTTEIGQRLHVLHKMIDMHKDLFQWGAQQLFQQHDSYIQQLLHHQIKDPLRKTQYQQELDALQADYQESSNPDSQHWQKGLQEIVALRNTVVDHAWKDDFEQLKAKIGHLLQTLREDVVEDKYRNKYKKLQQTYDKLSQGGQKLGASSETSECYEKMAVFHQDLLGVSEMNRRYNEIKDDMQELEHYTNEVEKKFQRHVGQVHRVWSAENGQGQPITYAQFTDPEGKEHSEEVVEFVEGTDTTTKKAVKGHYCPKTQHFLSSDRQTVYEAQLINEGQQLRLKEIPWKQRLHEWAKPADTQVRLKLEEAKQTIWKVLSRDESQAHLELSLDFHGSYLSKTMNAGSDADIHIAFKNNPLNNPFYNDLLKYREKMNNALIEAFTKEHVKEDVIVTTIDKKAFGMEADIFPAFYHTFEGGHKGLISFTKEKQIITHFIKQKRQNAQTKSESTVYRFRGMIRIIKSIREKVDIDKEKMPSFIIESLAHNTPDEHFVDSIPEGKPIKRDLADTLNRVLTHCIKHTATDEACQEWKEVDGIKYLFNHAANTPWDIELKDVKYRYTGKHNIPRADVHQYLKKIQEYTQTQQDGQFQSIQLSHPLVPTSPSQENDEVDEQTNLASSSL